MVSKSIGLLPDTRNNVYDFDKESRTGFRADTIESKEPEDRYIPRRQLLTLFNNKRKKRGELEDYGS